MVPENSDLKYQEYGRKSKREIGGSEVVDSECYYILRCETVQYAKNGSNVPDGRRHMFTSTYPYKLCVFLTSTLPGGE